jgi:hypothetical protein
MPVTTGTSGTAYESLAQRLARGRLQPGEAMDILQRLLKALAFLHWSGAVHGCITPETISVGPVGQINLAAGVGGPGTGVLPPLAIPDTPAHPEYLAPEQIKGEQVDARADVFAVGVIAHEMLTGRNPFGARLGASASQIMARIVDDPSPHLDPTLAARLPAGVAAALDRAVAKDPNARFAGAQPFLDALIGPEATAPATPATGAAPGTKGAPAKSSAAHRHKRLNGPYVALGIAIVIVAIGLAWFALTYAGSSSRLLQTTGTLDAVSAATSTSVPGGPTTGSTTVATDPNAVVTTAPGGTASTGPGGTGSSLTPTTLRPTIPATTRLEETATQLAYSGAWISLTEQSDSAGRCKRANGAGATVTVTFNGTYLAWVAKKGSSYGIAKVTLNGTTAQTVDLYSSKTLYAQKVWESGLLAPGLHTATIEWTGTKNAAATGASICVDAFDVAGQVVSFTRFEETKSQLTWAGTWKRTSTGSASGGSFKFADSSGAAVTIAFTGQALEIVAKKGPTYGQAKITLDGAQTSTVDLYSGAVEWGATVWSSGLLTDGAHTVKIEWTGTKSPAATGTNIDIDAVRVIGTLR